MSAGRNGMAVSRFLIAAAAGIILLCFAAEGRRSHCNGCMKVANGALAADVSILALMISLENSFYRRFSALASRSGFGAANSCNLCIAVVRKFHSCLQFSVCGSQWIAASRLLTVVNRKVMAA